MKNKQKILIVEDSPSQLLLIDAFVQRFGFDTHAVTCGYDALEAVRTIKFAAVLMDINLPDISGFECTRQIKSMGACRQLPVIAITAERMDELFESECRAAGMDDCLAKPFQAEALRKVLLRHTYEPSYPNLKLLPDSQGKPSKPESLPL
ncbi:MAG: response regulator [Candidatus Obscuribacterales bacterium]|nr:response regulator [Candidatus Obscuribacterales bacterium]